MSAVEKGAVKLVTLAADPRKTCSDCWEAILRVPTASNAAQTAAAAAARAAETAPLAVPIEDEEDHEAGAGEINTGAVGDNEFPVSSRAPALVAAAAEAALLAPMDLRLDMISPELRARAAASARTVPRGPPPLPERTLSSAYAAAAEAAAAARAGAAMEGGSFDDDDDDEVELSFAPNAPSVDMGVVRIASTDVQSRSSRLQT